MSAVLNVTDLDQSDNNVQDFFIHFDLINNIHQIPISQSIITEQSIQILIQEINKHLFDNKLEIQIFVYPQEPGSLLKKIGYVITGGIGLAWFFVESTAGNRIIKGLTGKEWGDYVEEKTILVKESVIGFLQNKNQDLINNSISYDTFYKAYDAKNKFYQAAMSNRKVKAIGFDNSSNFPVKKDEFYYRVVDLKEKIENINPIDKFHKLIVVSSINTKEDSKLAWQVKDQKLKKRFDVYMKDDAFYKEFLLNPVYLKTLLVKVRYSLDRDVNGDIQIDKKEIITVYCANDIEILPLPEGAKIEPAPWSVGSIILDIEAQSDLFQNGSLFEGVLDI